MYTPLLAVGLLVLCGIVTALVALNAFRRAAAASGAFLRFASVAGVASVGSSAMYLSFSELPTSVTLILGDVAMVCGPAFLWVGLRALGPGIRRALIVTTAGAVVTAASSTLLPADAALAVKGVMLAIFCLLAAHATRHRAVRALRGTALLRGAATSYAAYSLLRTLTIATLGTGSEVFMLTMSIGPATIVGSATVVTVGAASLKIANDARYRRTAPPRRLAPDGSEWRVSVPDFALIPAAYGTDQADAVHRWLLEACRAIDPGAESTRGGEVIVRLPDDEAGAQQRIQDRYAELASGTEVFVEPVTFEERR